MVYQEINKLEADWKGRTDVTPEFQQWLDSLKKVRTVKCPKCFKTRFIDPSVVMVVCNCCQVEMVEVEA